MTIYQCFATAFCQAFSINPILTLDLPNSPLSFLLRCRNIGAQYPSKLQSDFTSSALSYSGHATSEGYSTESLEPFGLRSCSPGRSSGTEYQPKVSGDPTVRTGAFFLKILLKSAEEAFEHAAGDLWTYERRLTSNLVSRRENAVNNAGLSWIQLSSRTYRQYGRP